MEGLHNLFRCRYIRRNSKKETLTMRNVKIDMEKCTNCRECVEVCPEEVFQLVNGIPVHVHSEKCIECDLCIDICPEDAISIVTH
ncbi:MAG: ferredoxin family protein [Candidatus Electrothrix sp.]